MFSRLEELYGLLKSTICMIENQKKDIDEAFRIFKTLISDTTENKGIVYVIGNGGSAGIASHFCTDLVKTLNIASMTLTDSNLLTCISNDYGYENSYMSPLKVLMTKKDMLVAISSSGKSANIINAANFAKEIGAKVVTLSGFGKLNPLKEIGNLNFYLNKSDYGLVEMGHFFILHTIVDLYHKIPKNISDFLHFATIC